MLPLIILGIFLLVAFVLHANRSNGNQAKREARPDLRVRIAFESQTSTAPPPRRRPVDDPLTTSIEKLFLSRLGKGVDRHSFSRIAGLSHPNPDGTSRRKILRGCRRFEGFLLVREPNNAFDPNAVMIFTGRDQMLGYIPREKAAKIAPSMDQGKVWLALLLSVGGTPQHPATRLLLYRLTKNGKANLLQLAKSAVSGKPPSMLAATHDKSVSEAVI